MQKPYTRYNDAHAAKRQLLGSQALFVKPAWKSNVQSTGQGVGGSVKGKEIQGSKIFISGLPHDVGLKEIEELFRKTVGPLKDIFIVYNSQGRSKGMAVVVFQRPGDAEVARTKYHGKIVDARRPIKIELLVDSMLSFPSTTTSVSPTLLSRIAPSKSDAVKINGHSTPLSPLPQRLTHAVIKPAAIPPRRIRQKKGPKRLKKRKTVEDLDKEMDDYRAAAPNNFS